MSQFRPRNRSYWLAQLCESNFRQLCELVPDLTTLSDDATARAQGKPPLHLKVIERSPYTLTLELSHCFGPEVDRRFEPSICVRVYLDGRCAEALPPHRPPLASRRHQPHAGGAEVLEEKWSSNYFLQRWLEHCLRSQYRFGLSAGVAGPPALA
ncbi:DUF1249 domain-containing protein [Methylotetracoccus oryzae]|uniref:DUF1249 domain-containing protein n=1 Tax=Methylotetracoccus oryzae TaxID=1919059 RepID=UPI00111A3849|nr:DUF1249 domain-containing protein [Methylotetracoccus oryzae]